MTEEFSRTERLIGAGAMERLKNARVAVFGVGGVGGYVAEALARSGVGALDLIDSDTVNLSNINRQIIALRKIRGKHIRSSWRTGRRKQKNGTAIHSPCLSFR